MDINTSHCRNAATAAEESSSKLREVYEGLDWRDEVYESFEAFVDDVEKASKRIADLAVQAADIADSLADIFGRLSLPAQCPRGCKPSRLQRM